jgi:archaellum biogenesis protein FlaJ (TadC family)
MAFQKWKQNFKRSLRPYKEYTKEELTKYVKATRFGSLSPLLGAVMIMPFLLFTVTNSVLSFSDKNSLVALFLSAIVLLIVMSNSNGQDRMKAQFELRIREAKEEKA